jgi:hypothetical protein
MNDGNNNKNMFGCAPSRQLHERRVGVPAANFSDTQPCDTTTIRFHLKQPMLPKSTVSRTATTRIPRHLLIDPVRGG